MAQPTRCGENGSPEVEPRQSEENGEEGKGKLLGALGWSAPFFIYYFFVLILAYIFQFYGFMNWSCLA